MYNDGIFIRRKMEPFVIYPADPGFCRLLSIQKLSTYRCLANSADCCVINENPSSGIKRISFPEEVILSIL
ncbi:hypothetical protein TNCV_679471 [Trichonephila clavipes]|nr:hypothetical protein TNCV_679471 [Trichonephila clavipes]